MAKIPVGYHIRAFAGSFLRRRALQSRQRFLATARTSCRAIQQHTLNRVLQLNAESAFSRDFGLRPGMTCAEFRAQVPVSDYSLVAPYIERMKTGEHSALLGPSNRLVMYALTSGTTADSRLIPVTDQFVRDYRRFWQAWGVAAWYRHPLLQRLNIVQISSSHQRFHTADGTPCGNISGLVAAMQKRVVRSLYTIPSEVAEVTDPDAKRYLIVRLALADPCVGIIITANPSTVLQMADTVQRQAEHLLKDIHDGGVSGIDIPDTVLARIRRSLRPAPQRTRELEQLRAQDGLLRPRAIWPHLQLLGVWSGGSAAAYMPQLKTLFDNIPTRDHGLHASEGRMTMPLEDDRPAGVLEIETHFFEFLPVEEIDSTQPAVLEAHEVREGGEYYILLTTCSGLYRYNIRDVVRCTGFLGATPMFEFLHKGAHISSITGEKIAESQVVQAVRAASEATGTTLRLFTLTPAWGAPPRYQLFVAPADGTVAHDASRLAEVVDRQLCQRNLEYREKRETGRLAPITCRALPWRHWETFTRSRTSRGGGSIEQYKHPCLLPDPAFSNLFLKAAEIE